MHSKADQSGAPSGDWVGQEMAGGSDETGSPAWDMLVSDGPVLLTAIHAGHGIRPSLKPWLAITGGDRLREEDPLTDFFLSAGDTIFRANRSRFECDLNRPIERCISTDPDETWGLRVWNEPPPANEIAASHALHREFYALMADRVETMIAEHGEVLVLDLHSYNHRRISPNAKPAPQQDNPDIDLGATTLDHEVHGDLLAAFAQGLASRPLRGRMPDVRVNVRWKDGGHFPEWLHAAYGAKACVITLEYKKIFMDEWTGMADILALQDLREGFRAGLAQARDWLARRA
jgi:N-formylglutamate deformylase